MEHARYELIMNSIRDGYASVNSAMEEQAFYNITAVVNLVSKYYGSSSNEWQSSKQLKDVLKAVIERLRIRMLSNKPGVVNATIKIMDYIFKNTNEVPKRLLRKAHVLKTLQLVSRRQLSSTETYRNEIGCIIAIIMNGWEDAAVVALGSSSLETRDVPIHHCQASDALASMSNSVTQQDLLLVPEPSSSLSQGNVSNRSSSGQSSDYRLGSLDSSPGSSFPAAFAAKQSPPRLSADAPAGFNEFAAGNARDKQSRLRQLRELSRSVATETQSSSRCFQPHSTRQNDVDNWTEYESNRHPTHAEGEAVKTDRMAKMANSLMQQMKEESQRPTLRAREKDTTAPNLGQEPTAAPPGHEQQNDLDFAELTFHNSSSATDQKQVMELTRNDVPQLAHKPHDSTALQQLLQIWNKPPAKPSASTSVCSDPTVEFKFYGTQRVATRSSDISPHI